MSILTTIAMHEGAQMPTEQRTKYWTRDMVGLLLLLPVLLGLCAVLLIATNSLINIGECVMYGNCL